jgi:hypothetical protein
MRRSTLSFLLCSVAAACILPTAACSGGDIAVGKTSQSEQELKKRMDGTATGNGQTCSWEGTVGYDVATGQTTSTPAANGPYSVGQAFKSVDGCNDCSCSALGIMCTMRACAPGSSSGSSGNTVDPGGPGCTLEAMVCPDGSAVGRTGPNCTFAPCPSANACTEEAKGCPDGSTVVRTGPNCEFAPCPAECTNEQCGPAPGMPNYLCSDGVTTAGPGPCVRTNGVCGWKIISCPSDGVACPADAKLCPDGSYVSRTGPNCTFAACPQ